MNPTKEMVLGMALDRWEVDSCVAHFGTGIVFATLWNIESKIKRQGHATKLLLEAEEYYAKQGKVFGGSVALSPEMRKLYKKLGMVEYK